MNRKKVYIGLTADIMHHGLVHIIQEGAKYGEVIIGLLTDKAIAEYKRLPYLNFDQRKAVVSAIRGVSEVVAQEEWDYSPTLRQLKPQIMLHGDDWKQGAQKRFREKAFLAMAEWGGEIIEIPYTKGISSSQLSKDATDETTPGMRLTLLRRLIEAKPIVRILESHSGLTGLIIEHTVYEDNNGRRGFDGMWSSSLTDSASKGKPDIEAVDITTRLQSLTDMLECTTKPIIYDGDTGGRVEHLPFTIRTLERHGIAAIIIEDKVGLKKNSLLGTDVPQEQDSIEEFSLKIRTGKQAQVTEDFMLIARIESLILGKTIDDALKRAFAYVEAGADGIMIHSKEQTGDDIRDFCQQFRQKEKVIPLVVVPTTYSQIKEAELVAIGVNIVIYANHMLRSAYPAMQQTARSILKHERALEADQHCMSIKEILELIPGTK